MPTAMPISRTMEEAALLTGIQCAATWSRPNAPSTLVTASRSGIPAATSEPNTTSRMTTVSGREKNSARFMSSLMPSSTASDRLLSPACATRTSGWSAATRSTSDAIAS